VAKDRNWRRARFFRNKDGLKQARVEKDLQAALRKAEAVILAVPHTPYRELDPDWVRSAAGTSSGSRRRCGREAILEHDAQLGELDLADVERVGLLGRGEVQRGVVSQADAEAAAGEVGQAHHQQHGVVLVDLLVVVAADHLAVDLRQAPVLEEGLPRGGSGRR
jgi:hypothetical protein